MIAMNEHEGDNMRDGAASTSKGLTQTSTRRSRSSRHGHEQSMIQLSSASAVIATASSMNLYQVTIEFSEEKILDQSQSHNEDRPRRSSSGSSRQLLSALSGGHGGEDSSNSSMTKRCIRWIFEYTASASERDYINETNNEAYETTSTDWERQHYVELEWISSALPPKPNEIADTSTERNNKKSRRREQQQHDCRLFLNGEMIHNETVLSDKQLVTTGGNNEKQGSLRNLFRGSSRKRVTTYHQLSTRSTSNKPPELFRHSFALMQRSNQHTSSRRSTIRDNGDSSQGLLLCEMEFRAPADVLDSTEAAIRGCSLTFDLGAKDQNTPFQLLPMTPNVPETSMKKGGSARNLFGSARNLLNLPANIINSSRAKSRPKGRSQSRPKERERDAVAAAAAVGFAPSSPSSPSRRNLGVKARSMHSGLSIRNKRGGDPASAPSANGGGNRKSPFASPGASGTNMDSHKSVISSSSNDRSDRRNKTSSTRNRLAKLGGSSKSHLFGHTSSLTSPSQPNLNEDMEDDAQSPRHKSKAAAKTPTPPKEDNSKFGFVRQKGGNRPSLMFAQTSSKRNVRHASSRKKGEEPSGGNGADNGSANAMSDPSSDPPTSRTTTTVRRVNNHPPTPAVVLTAEERRIQERIQASTADGFSNGNSNHNKKERKSFSQCVKELGLVLTSGNSSGNKDEDSSANSLQPQLEPPSIPSFSNPSQQLHRQERSFPKNKHKNSLGRFLASTELKETATLGIGSKRRSGNPYRNLNPDDPLSQTPSSHLLSSQPQARLYASRSNEEDGDDDDDDDLVTAKSQPKPSSRSRNKQDGTSGPPPRTTKSSRALSGEAGEHDKNKESSLVDAATPLAAPPTPQTQRQRQIRSDGGGGKGLRDKSGSHRRRSHDSVRELLMTGEESKREMGDGLDDSTPVTKPPRRRRSSNDDIAGHDNGATPRGRRARARPALQKANSEQSMLSVRNHGAEHEEMKRESMPMLSRQSSSSALSKRRESIDQQHDSGGGVGNRTTQSTISSKASMGGAQSDVRSAVSTGTVSSAGGVAPPSSTRNFRRHTTSNASRRNVAALTEPAQEPLSSGTKHATHATGTGGRRGIERKTSSRVAYTNQALHGAMRKQVAPPTSRSRGTVSEPSSPASNRRALQSSLPPTHSGGEITRVVSGSTMFSTPKDVAGASSSAVSSTISTGGENSRSMRRSRLDIVDEFAPASSITNKKSSTSTTQSKDSPEVSFQMNEEPPSFNEAKDHNFGLVSNLVKRLSLPHDISNNNDEDEVGDDASTVNSMKDGLFCLQHSTRRGFEASSRTLDDFSYGGGNDSSSLVSGASSSVVTSNSNSQVWDALKLMQGPLGGSGNMDASPSALLFLDDDRSLDEDGNIVVGGLRRIVNISRKSSSLQGTSSDGNNQVGSTSTSNSPSKPSSKTQHPHQHQHDILVSPVSKGSNQVTGTDIDVQEKSSSTPTAPRNSKAGRAKSKEETGELTEPAKPSRSPKHDEIKSSRQRNSSHLSPSSSSPDRRSDNKSLDSTFVGATTTASGHSLPSLPTSSACSVSSEMALGAENCNDAAGKSKSSGRSAKHAGGGRIPFLEAMAHCHEPSLARKNSLPSLSKRPSKRKSSSKPSSRSSNCRRHSTSGGSTTERTTESLHLQDALEHLPTVPFVEAIPYYHESSPTSKTSLPFPSQGRRKSKSSSKPSSRSSNCRRHSTSGGSTTERMTEPLHLQDALEHLPTMELPLVTK
jgi:hypothetical protein